VTLTPPEVFEIIGTDAPLRADLARGQMACGNEISSGFVADLQSFAYLGKGQESHADRHR
jgi:hypothetical protein